MKKQELVSKLKKPDGKSHKAEITSWRRTRKNPESRFRFLATVKSMSILHGASWRVRD